MSEETTTTEQSAAESRDGEIQISLQDHAMSAVLRVIPPNGAGKIPTYQEALDKLASMKIKYGLNEGLLEDVFDIGMFNEDHTVAQGETPVPGADGKLEMHVNLDRKVIPKEDAKGNVDFRDLNLIVVVAKGDLIAETIPPTPGVPGKNVLGEEITAPDGNPAKLPQGTNTEVEPNDINKLIASTEGSVVSFENGNVIEVHPEHMVNGDVDFGTGNIDYVGSVVVKGDVKSGFRIKAGGDVEISGVVEDAIIEAGGKVILAMGIVGTGQGKVIAGGDVYLKYIENQSITTKGSVMAGEAILHSTIRADKKVLVNGRKGAIIGGEVLAVEGVEAKSIGNYQYAKTEVLVGINEEARLRMEQIDSDIKQSKENEEKIKAAIYNLVKTSKKLSPERQNLMKKMQQAKAVLPKQIETLEAEREELEQEVMKYAHAQVKVMGTIFPNARLQIANQRTRISEEQQFVQFQLDGMDITATKYSR
jgi:uncharacterized protein